MQYAPGLIPIWPPAEQQSVPGYAVLAVILLWHVFLRSVPCSLPSVPFCFILHIRTKKKDTLLVQKWRQRQLSAFSGQSCADAKVLRWNLKRAPQPGWRLQPTLREQRVYCQRWPHHLWSGVECFTERSITTIPRDTSSQYSPYYNSNFHVSMTRCNVMIREWPRMGATYEHPLHSKQYPRARNVGSYPCPMITHTSHTDTALRFVSCCPISREFRSSVILKLRPS